jgi:hypothetical protein
VYGLRTAFNLVYAAVQEEESKLAAAQREIRGAEKTAKKVETDADADGATSMRIFTQVSYTN